MLFEELTMADIRRLFTALMALGGDDMVRKLIERVPAEMQPHNRVTIGSLLKLLEQTNDSTILPEEIVALLKALSQPGQNDQDMLAAVARLVAGTGMVEEMPDFLNELYDDEFDNAREEVIEPPLIADPDVFDEGPDSVFETIETEPDIDDEAFFNMPNERRPEPEPLPDPLAAAAMQETCQQEEKDFYDRLFGKVDPTTPATLADQRFNEFIRKIKQGKPRNDLLMTSTIGATVAVNHTVPISQQVNLANCFASVDLVIANDLRYRHVTIADRFRGATLEQCLIVTLKRAAPVSAINRELKRLGYRHATIDELVAFADSRQPIKDLPVPNKNNVVRVIAAGTKLSDHGIHVPCLQMSKRHGELELSTEFAADLWQLGSHFLVVKKN